MKTSSLPYTFWLFSICCFLFLSVTSLSDSEYAELAEKKMEDEINLMAQWAEEAEKTKESTSVGTKGNVQDQRGNIETATEEQSSEKANMRIKPEVDSGPATVESTSDHGTVESIPEPEKVPVAIKEEESETPTEETDPDPELDPVEETHLESAIDVRSNEGKERPETITVETEENILEREIEEALQAVLLEESEKKRALEGAQKEALLQVEKQLLEEMPETESEVSDQVENVGTPDRDRQREEKATRMREKISAQTQRIGEREDLSTPDKNRERAEKAKAVLKELENNLIVNTENEEENTLERYKHRFSALNLKIKQIYSGGNDDSLVSLAELRKEYKHLRQLIRQEAARRTRSAARDSSETRNERSAESTARARYRSTPAVRLSERKSQQKKPSTYNKLKDLINAIPDLTESSKKMLLGEVDDFEIDLLSIRTTAREDPEAGTESIKMLVSRVAEFEKELRLKYALEADL